MKTLSNFISIISSPYFNLRTQSFSEKDKRISEIVQKVKWSKLDRKYLAETIVRDSDKLEFKLSKIQIKEITLRFKEKETSCFIESILRQMSIHSSVDVRKLLLPYIQNDFLCLPDETLGQAFQRVYEDNKLFLENSYGPENPLSTTKKASLALSIFFPGIIEACLKAFTFFNEGRVPEVPYELGALLGIYQAMAMLPIGITYGIYKIIDNGLQAVVVSVIIHGVALTCLGMYLKWKPAPKVLEGCRNLTLELQSGQLNTVVETDDLAQSLKVFLCPPGIEPPRHVCLYGMTGQGKTGTLYVLTRILPPGKQLIYINTAGLGKQFSNFTNEFNILLNRIKGHENEFILVLDEIDAAARLTGVEVIKYLQPVLDRRSSGIGFIVVTTDKGYEKYIKNNEEFEGRFECIPMQPVTEIARIRMLQEYVIKFANDLLIPSKTISLIAKKFKNLREAENELVRKIAKVRKVFDHYRSPSVARQEQMLANLKGKARLHGVLEGNLKAKIENHVKKLEIYKKRELNIQNKINWAKFLTKLHKNEITFREEFIKSNVMGTISEDIKKEFLLSQYLSQLSFRLVQNIKLPETIPVMVS